MSKIKQSFHGSDLEIIAKEYNINQADIIPFASNVNPLGMSPMARDALIKQVDAITSYPDREYTVLKEAIANYCATTTDSLILGNGTSELIRLVLEKLAPKKTMVLGPTYSEYITAAKHVGSETAMYMLSHLDDFELDTERLFNALDESFDLLILCNPNNPTSKLISKAVLDDIIAHCLDKHIFVMVDETYMEFVLDVKASSAISLTKEYRNLIVLRSTSKFFATPGLRLGYAITSNEKLLTAFDSKKIPWSINSYATVASVMFSDDHYMNLTTSLIHTERNLVYSALKTRKTIHVFKPEANFVLIRLLKEDLTATDVFNHCIQKGLMIRDCTNYVGLGDKYIRFCFLKPEQNDAVVNAILEIV